MHDRSDLKNLPTGNQIATTAKPSLINVGELSFPKKTFIENPIFQAQFDKVKNLKDGYKG